MVRINVLFHLLINGVYWAYNPRILTISSLPTGHPSRGKFYLQIVKVQQEKIQ